MIFFAIFIIVKKNLRLIYLSLGNISVYTNTQLHTKNVLFKLLTKNTILSSHFQYCWWNENPLNISKKGASKQQ